MTTSQMHPVSQLEPPGTGDAMELSPDADRRLTQDEDIDLDLDLTEERNQDVDDENMVEDSDSPEADGNARLDDLMAEDGDLENDFPEDTSIYDEEIFDAEFTAPDVDEDTVVESFADNPADLQQDIISNLQEPLVDPAEEQRRVPRSAENPSVAPTEVYQGALVVPPQDSEIPDEHSSSYDEHPALADPGPEEEGHAEAEGELSQVESGEPSAGTYDRVELAGDESHRNEAPMQQQNTAGHVTKDLPEDQPAIPEADLPRDQPDSSLQRTDEAIPQGTSALNEEISAKSSDHLHTVIVIYQDSEMSLFPPVHQDQEDTQTFLLEDEEIAFDTLENLLRACRIVLGDSIGEQDELEIAIDDLDLHISEVSDASVLRKEALANAFQFSTELPSTSLAGLIGIYVQLQHQDGVEVPPPLYINLYTKARLSYHLNYLVNAVNEGKGLSQIKLTNSLEAQGPEEGLDRDVQGDATDTDFATILAPGLLEKSALIHDHNGAPPINQNDDSHLPDYLERPIDDETALAVLDDPVSTDIEKPRDGTEQWDELHVTNAHTNKQSPNDVKPGTDDSPEEPEVSTVSADNYLQAQEQIVGEDEGFLDEEEDQAVQGSSSGSSTVQEDLAERAKSPPQAGSISKAKTDPEDAMDTQVTASTSAAKDSNDKAGSDGNNGAKTFEEYPPLASRADNNDAQQGGESEAEANQDARELDGDDNFNQADVTQITDEANEDREEAFLGSMDHTSHDLETSYESENEANVEDGFTLNVLSDHTTAEAPRDIVSTVYPQQNDTNDLFDGEDQDATNDLYDDSFGGNATTDVYYGDDRTANNVLALPKLEDPTDFFQVDEEISFEDEGGNLHSLQTSVSEQKNTLNPGSLKRRRTQENEDGDDAPETEAQGEHSLFAVYSRKEETLMHERAESKRARS